jgi:hypothetical protein
MMRDRRTGERIIVDLGHSPETYRMRYRFPIGYIWVFPTEAWAALREAMPWEALGVSLLLATVLWLKFGGDLGSSLGFAIALALVTIQMLRSRRFVTATRIVQQRGLILMDRQEIPLLTISDGRVELPADGERFGDIVLSTSSGERRLRAIHDPTSVLRRLLSLRDSATLGDAVHA